MMTFLDEASLILQRIKALESSEAFLWQYYMSAPHSENASIEKKLDITERRLQDLEIALKQLICESYCRCSGRANYARKR